MSGSRGRRGRNRKSGALDGIDSAGEVAGAGCDLLGCELFGCGAPLIAFLAIGLGYWWL